jgi:hypothetical protein
MRFKVYIIGVLLVGIILLSSIIYKNGKELILQDFPIEKIVKKQRSDIPYFYNIDYLLL